MPRLTQTDTPALPSAALATPDLIRGSGQRGNSMNARAGHSPEEGSSARAPSAANGWLRRFSSLEWRLLAPIPVIVVIATVLVWVVIPRVVSANLTNEAIRAGQQVAAQLKKIRAYYTENVVNKALKSGALKTAVDHRADDKAIPVPATLVHELSSLLTEKDTAISLYSMYPFANRKDRVLDPFQQQAWDFLVANPGATFSRNEVRDGKQIVRVAAPTPWRLRASTATIPARYPRRRIGSSATCAACSRSRR
jgi:hypothetical protein